jgi:hypothetical protein
LLLKRFFGATAAATHSKELRCLKCRVNWTRHHRG